MKNEDESFMKEDAVYTKKEVLDAFCNFYVKNFGKLQNPESDPDGKVINGVTIYGMISLALD